jgi:hypothetical protein
VLVARKHFLACPSCVVAVILCQQTLFDSCHRTHVTAAKSCHKDCKCSTTKLSAIRVLALFFAFQLVTGVSSTTKLSVASVHPKQRAGVISDCPAGARISTSDMQEKAAHHHPSDSTSCWRPGGCARADILFPARVGLQARTESAQNITARNHSLLAKRVFDLKSLSGKRVKVYLCKCPIEEIYILSLMTSGCASMWFSIGMMCTLSRAHMHACMHACSTSLFLVELSHQPQRITA